MGKVVAFELPWPPSVNRYYRYVGSRVLISREGRLYREAVTTLLRPLLDEPLQGPISLTAEFFPPDNRRRDLDNLLKCSQDTMQHAGLFLDDSQIKELHVFKGAPVPPNGLARIRLQSL